MFRDVLNSCRVLTHIYIRVINVTPACGRGCVASAALLVTKEESAKERATDRNEHSRCGTGNFEGDVGRGQS